jgi:sporulation integral membrane protein YtvI
MPTKVEKRREFLINLLFLVAVLALVFVFFKYLFWVTAPFVLTFLFAILLQHPLRWLDKKTHNKMHTFWSIFLILISLAIIIGPISFIISAIIDKLTEFAKYLSNLMSDIPNFLTALENKAIDFGKFLPDGVYSSYCKTITDTFTNLLEQTTSSDSAAINFDTIKNSLSTGISGVYGFVKNVPSVLLGIVIGIIAWIFFTKDYKQIVKFIQKQFPEGKKNLLVEIKQVFTKTIFKMFKAYGLIMLITFCELFLGFSILKIIGIMQNRYFVWIAVGIAIFDILPIAGSGGILIPWALFSLVMGNYKQAVGLIIIYAVITIIRQYIEPKIVGDSLGVHPIITLMGLYFGLKLFGFIGMFVVPITVMTLKAFNDTGRIQLWKPADRN